MGGEGDCEQDGTVCTTTAASTLYTVLYNLLYCMYVPPVPRAAHPFD